MKINFALLYEPRSMKKSCLQDFRPGMPAQQPKLARDWIFLDGFRKKRF